MDPYFEQRLRDEVLYLHSLWRQGPPRNPNPNPNPNPNHNPSRHLQPSNSTHFKNDQKKIRGRRGRKGKKKPPESDPPPVSDVEWPCKAPAETQTATTSGWPTLKLQSAPAIRLPSAEQQARFAANQVQQKGLKSAQEFFAGNVDSDGDSDEEMEDEDDMMGDYGCEEYKFFFNVFMEDNELRGYYEKNYEGGDFCCLVCGGVGKKVGKRFKDCVALVQHSIAIAKTKKKRAHRAYGQVICKVLGWDINRLPTIVLSLGDPLGRSLPKSGEPQRNADGSTEDSSMLNKDSGSENVNNGELIPKEVSNVCQKEELHNRSVGGMSNVVTDDLMVCENSMKVTDTNNIMEDFDKGVSSTVDGNTEGVVNCLEPFKEDGLGSVGKEIKNNQNEIVVLDGQKEDDKNQN